jgi:hypothetical protein
MQITVEYYKYLLYPWPPSNLAVPDCLLMSNLKNPLHVLQKGLAKLKDAVKGRKDNLLACLNGKEKISDEDEEWLDNAGNLVDEEAIVDLLVGKVSEEEIFKSVQDMLEAEQMMEINGGDDVDKETVKAKPTCKEALMATFTLQKYITDIYLQPMGTTL